MASPGLSELVTHTQRNRPGRVIDLVTKNNGFFHQMKKMKRIKTESGGRTLVRELDYQENGSFGWYDSYDELSVAPSDILTAAEFDWKQAAVFVSIDGKTKLINRGPDRVVDIYKTRIDNAERTLVNKISLACYGDGTGSGGKEIGGLQLLVADSPSSGTVGGIDRASWTFWRNVAFDFSSSSIGAAASSANIQTGMIKTELQISRRSTGDKPDIWLFGNDYFEYFWASLTPLQRFADAEEADLGFKVLSFNGSKVICDGGIGGGISDGTKKGYALCSKYLDFTIMEGANFEQIGGKREPVNQHAEGVFLGFMGNMTMSNAFVQAVMKD